VWRLLRILRASLVILSLLLCIASIVFWIRSHRVGGIFHLSPFPNKWSLATSYGTLWLYCDMPLNPPHRIGNFERSFWGFGTSERQEIRNYDPVKPPGKIEYGTHIKGYFVPLWFCAILFAILPLLQLHSLARLRRRRKKGLCVNCGYDLRASGNQCPECGMTPRRSTKAPPASAAAS
jgi:hypothetical protein